MNEAVTVTEAARRLGVSRTKVWTMIRHGNLTVYPDPLDRRQRLIPLEEIRQLQARRGLINGPGPRVGSPRGGSGQSQGYQDGVGPETISLLDLIGQYTVEGVAPDLDTLREEMAYDLAREVLADCGRPEGVPAR